MTRMRSRLISPFPISVLRSYTTDDDEADKKTHTFPTAASPRRTSLTLLLGLGGAAAESAIVVRGICRYTNGRA